MKLARCGQGVAGCERPLNLARAGRLSDFPAEHRRPIDATNPLQRLNKELKRRSAVVGIVPNRATAVRLLGVVLVEQHEEWLVGRRSVSETSMRRLLDPAGDHAMPQVEAPAA